jgi:FMN phosphatase YigB (HAD superfamily)
MISKTKNISAVLFDFGDTLVDYPLRDTKGQLSYIESFITRLADDGIVSLSKFNTVQAFAEQLNSENLDDSTWPFTERLRSDKFFGPDFDLATAERLEREICDGVFAQAKILPDALPTLIELKKRGIKTGIVSNLPWGTSSKIWVEEFARHGFSSDIIDVVVC